MAWYSILPPQLEFIERWVIRICLALAIINISPWILAIVYDIILYVLRRVWHEVPVWGGRASGDARPRAPSLRDRSRRLSFAELIRGSSPSRGNYDSRDDVRRRHKAHVRNTSTVSASIEEELDDGAG